MLAMHSAVLGATGSGKSHFIKRYIADFLHPYNEKTWKGRIVIIDTHGEYTKSLQDASVPFATIKVGAGDKTSFDTPLVESLDDLEDLFGFKPDKRLKKTILALLSNPSALTQDAFVQALVDAASDDARKDLDQYATSLISLVDTTGLPDDYRKDVERAQAKSALVNTIFDKTRRNSAKANLQRDLIREAPQGLRICGCGDSGR